MTQPAAPTPAPAARCPRCDRPLRHALDGLCPACLMRQALTGTSPTDLASPAAPGSVLFTSSFSPSTWMLITMIADDPEHATYLAQEQRDRGEGRKQDAGASPRLGQLVVRKKAVAPAEMSRAHAQLRQRQATLRESRVETLAAVLDGGVTGEGNPFLVTAYSVAAPLADIAITADATADLLNDARQALQTLHAAGLAHGRVDASTILARRTRRGATTVVTGFAPLDRFPTLSAAVADDLERLQRLTSSLRA